MTIQDVAVSALCKARGPDYPAKHQKLLVKIQTVVLYASVDVNKSAFITQEQDVSLFQLSKKRQQFIMSAEHRTFLLIC